ncbi:hypothetical protein GW17_00057371, partial [Ensete ventricosum]
MGIAPTGWPMGRGIARGGGARLRAGAATCSAQGCRLRRGNDDDDPLERGKGIRPPFFSFIVGPNHIVACTTLPTSPSNACCHLLPLPVTSSLVADAVAYNPQPLTAIVPFLPCRAAFHCDSVVASTA